MSITINHTPDHEETEQDLRICDFCGAEFDLNEEGYDDRVRRVVLCGDCEDTHVICDHCNEYVDEDNVRELDNGDTVCIDCLEHSGYFEQCDNCGTWMHEDSAFHRHGYTYCESCHEDLRRDYPICEYHYGPELEFFGESRENLFFGIELEVDQLGRCDAEDDAYHIIKRMNQHVYCSEDGSLDSGFEIITHPHTYEEMRKLPWHDVCDYLEDNGYDNENETAGMHIHLSKSFFNHDFEMITRFVLFFEKFKDFAKAYSRRSECRIDDWCQFCTDKPGTHIQNPSKNDVKHHLLPYNSHGQCINIGNSNTVECRLFNSTTDADLILANLELVNLIAHKAKAWTDAAAESATLMDWLEGMSDNLYRKITNVYVLPIVHELKGVAA